MGWNIPYDFMNSDLKAAAQQMRMFVGEWLVMGTLTNHPQPPPEYWDYRLITSTTL